LALADLTNNDCLDVWTGLVNWNPHTSRYNSALL
jgi:hypothetical protein